MSLFWTDNSDLYYPGVYGEKWNVDEQELILSIRQLSLVGQIAFIQFIETFWQNSDMETTKYFKLK